MFVFLFSLASVSCASTVGVLSKLNVDEGDFAGFIRTEGMWKNLSGNHGDNDIIVFYDNILSMVLSLNTGDISEMELPEIVGKYVMQNRPDYKVFCNIKILKQEKNVSHSVFSKIKMKLCATNSTKLFPL